MLVRYIDRLARGWKVWNRIRYPGIRAARGANFYVDGTFTYGSGCSVGIGANIIVQHGARLELGDDCYVGRWVETGPTGRIKVGSHTSLQDRCIILGEVTIGRYCLFAPNVYISSGRHNFDVNPTWLIRDQDVHVAGDARLSALYSRPVVIEDDCWLGINSVIRQGVTIGKGAIVGANSVVVRDVEPYTVVAGSPAEVIRKRLDFKPPKRLTATRSDDWPYFYSGFDLTQRSLAEGAARGAITARNEFELSLDTATARHIHMIVKSTDGAQCSLSTGGQLEQIGSEFREVVFNSDPPPEQGPRVRVLVVPSGATVMVKEAWVR